MQNSQINNQESKAALSHSISKMHNEKLRIIGKKNRIRIIFLVIHKSVWKIDSVFQKMLSDKYFDPIIIVCPDIISNPESILEDMRDCTRFFRSKKYPVLSAYNEINNSWISLKDISPDIIFFTNPYSLTLKEYYSDAFTNYLSCYVPYFFLTTTHGGDEAIYNQNFHNAMWKIFMPHSYGMNRANITSANQGKNTVLVGYPACEDLIGDKSKAIDKAWKISEKSKIKIIFAPHHTIEDGELMLSNFLTVADHFLKYAIKYKSQIQWAFKPHPLLLSKLYKHPAWGKKRADQYYDFWKTQEFTQYNDGEYSQLFIESDAIIHDSASFITEYLFVMKPCAYLELNGSTQLKSINKFGSDALDAYYRIQKIEMIEYFIKKLINKESELLPAHIRFKDTYIDSFYNETFPSDRIIEIIKNEFHESQNYAI
jgi:hypothetical protein